LFQKQPRAPLYPEVRQPKRAAIASFRCSLPVAVNSRFYLARWLALSGSTFMGSLRFSFALEAPAADSFVANFALADCCLLPLFAVRAHLWRSAHTRAGLLGALSKAQGSAPHCWQHSLSLARSPPHWPAGGPQRAGCVAASSARRPVAAAQAPTTPPSAGRRLEPADI